MPPPTRPSLHLSLQNHRNRTDMLVPQNKTTFTISIRQPTWQTDSGRTPFLPPHASNAMEKRWRLVGPVSVSSPKPSIHGDVRLRRVTPLQASYLGV